MELPLVFDVLLRELRRDVILFCASGDMLTVSLMPESEMPLFSIL